MRRLRLWPTTKRTPPTLPVTSRGSLPSLPSSMLPATAVTGAILLERLESRRVHDVAGVDDVVDAGELLEDLRVEVTVRVGDHADTRALARLDHGHPPRSCWAAIIPPGRPSTPYSPPCDARGTCARRLGAWHLGDWGMSARYDTAGPSGAEKRGSRRTMMATRTARRPRRRRSKAARPAAKKPPVKPAAKKPAAKAPARSVRAAVEQAAEVGRRPGGAGAGPAADG